MAGPDVLTAKQESFCVLYASTRDGANSYRACYDVKEDSNPQYLAVAASELLADPRVSRRINELVLIGTPEKARQFGITECFERWLALASADPNELIGVRVGNCRYCRGANHKYQWREREYMEKLQEVELYNRMAAAPALHLPYPDCSGGFGFLHTLPPVDDCPECGGEGVERVVARDTRYLSPGAAMLYGGVKQTRNGIEIIIADQVKAFENLTRMLGGFKDGIKLDGTMSTMAAVVAVRESDPHRAAELYQAMVKRISA